MSAIAKVEARTVSIPLEAATSFSNRRVTERQYSLVRVTTEDGAQGVGFCYAGHKGGAIISLAVRELLAPVVVGEDAHRVTGLWQQMYHESILHGRVGSVMRGISAVDIAIWDRNARAADLPLWRYLGGVSEGSVPAYASGGYYLDGKEPSDLAREMRGYVDLGFKAVKLKVGGASAVADGERIGAVRDEVGPDVLVMLDANNAWDDVPSALHALDVWAEHDVFWIEEPFSPDDIGSHARLARATDILVATGEIEAGRWRHKELLDQEAAAILQTDAAVCGGVTEWRRIAATADSYGVPMYPHWFHDLHVQLVAATPNAKCVEFFVDDKVLNFRKLIDRQLEFANGELSLPTEPGLGFAWDDAAVDEYAIDDWG